MAKTPRPHQIAAREAVLADFDAGYRHLVVSMATGTGKTIFFGDLYSAMHSRLPGKMLVLAHTEELVDQNIAALQELYPDKRIDKEMAQHKADPSKADIIVASVASLGRKGTPRVQKYNWAEWDKIVVDEAHHTPAQSYQNVLDAAGVLTPESDKLLLGVTATTQRSDGKALSDFYSRISYVYGLEQAIKDGWLVDVRGYRVKTETSIDLVGNSGGDFEVKALGDKINNPERNAKVCAAWQKHGEDRQTVIFAATIAHAKALAETFKAQGIACEAIWGDDPDRAAKLEAHKKTEIKVLINVGVLVEGYDDWRIGCIVLARPTQSECLFTQMCGRGTRLSPNTGNLQEYTKNNGDPDKTDCIIIDVVDNTSSHSLVTLPSLMGLPENLDMKGASATKTKEKLEKIQAQNPNVDFSNLLTLDEVEAYVEHVYMFEVRFPAEVEANSDLKWHKTMDGGFRITVPGAAINKVGEKIERGPQGVVQIHKNVLGQWEIAGTIKEESFKGTRPTMEAAFVAADNVIRERAGQLLTFMNRKASWNDQPVTFGGPQDTLLRRLYPGRVWPRSLTKGQASYWIDKKIGRKR